MRTTFKINWIEVWILFQIKSKKKEFEKILPSCKQIQNKIDWFHFELVQPKYLRYFKYYYAFYRQILVTIKLYFHWLVSVEIKYFLKVFKNPLKDFNLKFKT